MDQATRANIRDYLKLSEDELETADILLQGSKYRACLSRCYYAMFYAVSALLLSKGIVRSKHSGVESAFHQFFVKPGLVDREFGKMYSDAREIRELSDYELLFVPAAELAHAQVIESRQLVDHIEKHLGEEMPENNTSSSN